MNDKGTELQQHWTGIFSAMMTKYSSNFHPLPRDDGVEILSQDFEVLCGHLIMSDWLNLLFSCDIPSLHITSVSY